MSVISFIELQAQLRDLYVTEKWSTRLEVKTMTSLEHRKGGRLRGRGIAQCQGRRGERREREWMNGFAARREEYTRIGKEPAEVNRSIKQSSHFNLTIYGHASLCNPNVWKSAYRNPLTPIILNTGSPVNKSALIKRHFFRGNVGRLITKYGGFFFCTLKIGLRFVCRWRRPVGP